METTTYNTPDELRVEVRVPAGHVTVLAKDTDVTTLEIAGVKNPDDLVISFGESSQGHRLVIEQRKKGLFNVSFTRGVEVRLTVPQQTKLVGQRWLHGPHRRRHHRCQLTSIARPATPPCTK